MGVKSDLISLSQREAVAAAAEEVAVVVAFLEVAVASIEVEDLVTEEAVEAEVVVLEDVEVVSIEDAVAHQDHHSAKATVKCYECHNEPILAPI